MRDLIKNITLLRFGMLSLILASVCSVTNAQAHHILGRPSYSLNEDSNTPPSLQVEARIGAYSVNYMIYPAFPRPGEPGRINLYVKNTFTGNPYVGKVDFSVRDNSWTAWAGLGANEEKLGAQVLDDNVYRQGYVFREPGAYIVTALFNDGAEPHAIDFPLQVGEIPGYGRSTKLLVFITLILIGLTLFQRRRMMTGRIKARLEEKS